MKEGLGWFSLPTKSSLAQAITHVFAFCCCIATIFQTSSQGGFHRCPTSLPCPFWGAQWMPCVARGLAVCLLQVPREQAIARFSTFHKKENQTKKSSNPQNNLPFLKPKSKLKTRSVLTSGMWDSGTARGMGITLTAQLFSLTNLDTCYVRLWRLRDRRKSHPLGDITVPLFAYPTALASANLPSLVWPLVSSFPIHVYAFFPMACCSWRFFRVPPTLPVFTFP